MSNKLPDRLRRLVIVVLGLSGYKGSMKAMVEQKAPLCDLVLEGGVTSGLIYLGAIAELSSHYQFKSLGGTSSGAISAATAAIAQRSKLKLLELKNAGNAGKDPDEPFTELGKFPGELADPSKQKKGRTALFQLFQPQEGTRRGYRILATLLDHWAPDKRVRALRYAIQEAVFQYPLAAIGGAFVGLWLLVFSFMSLRQTGDGIHAVSIAFAFVLAVSLGVVAAVLTAVYTTLKAMKRNHFGLCTGMEGEGSPKDDALTIKMHTLFNKLLGRGPEDRPVIFGELWGVSPEDLKALAGVARGSHYDEMLIALMLEKARKPDSEREINLQVIVSSLNLRRPFRLPNDPGTDPLRKFFYDPSEWKQFFPPAVMDWLKKADRLQGNSRVFNDKGIQLSALPEPPLWPVIVPVRMSCAFPGLLSAVPMYYLEGKDRADRSEKVPSSDASLTSGAERFVATKVYFCDGAITSNCPVHLFDAPLPSHPTFAIALDDLKSTKRGTKRVQLAAKPSVGPTDSIWSFAQTIAQTALDWQDGLQRALPGNRERIVTVELGPKEGGLNLAMKPETIRQLPELGKDAARALMNDFLTTQAEQRGNAWDRHRWLRLRNALAAVQRYLGELNLRQRRAAEQRDNDGPWVLTERELLDLEPSSEPTFADDAATDQARALFEGISELAEVGAASNKRDLSVNAPQPMPRLRMSPPW